MSSLVTFLIFLFFLDLAIYGLLRFVNSSHVKNFSRTSGQEIMQSKMRSLSNNYSIGREIEFVILAVFIIALLFLIPSLVFFLNKKDGAGFEIVLFSVGILFLAYLLLGGVRFFQRFKIFNDH
ncbi:MAG: hypothetical protein A2504_05800 [Bdellovibrionales bacterium RIFOXYD12_FULL_39_22]|nr:MAG: hypothetical protein A2385_06025 [Bdellovibrionales bacterium RIFOXYB1_FULL_39_21]OFZ41837.1 MAG: hypothetical protein A2485_07995 [Bdellovibrionales bacterium RIFOXYC12_FULL_39_17]OFZ50553.1 MAG: hypothetical protein A2404_04945 [Bdellovibrionales bacterium RIFOXYC1_FULL_39_130]OFZ75266.1 MAG: hypothetical protein A2451_12945 [Bdellovibrionales bacterium RIFOXYC2_FULL_39_8]OFZ77776.1 MAG: hypothetical protein A2560_00115 [Bdellovibrionales bacterium RIFOXYD1_FULL_39_84]OFZ93788.1 MAG: